MERMKGAVFLGREKGMRLEEVPVPRPDPGQVLVKVAACGICHTDLHYLDHGVPTGKEPPVILGHEASGTVFALGSGVKGWREGDRVLLPAVLTCGLCATCRIGRENICESMRMFGNHIDGAFAEFVLAPAKDLFSLPPELPLVESSVIADALSTPYHAVKNRGCVRPGDRVAVFGCGGVGINVVQCAAAAGASVIAVDISEERLKAAMALGAASTLNPSCVSKPEKEIREKTGGGADAAFEVVGKPETLRSALASLHRGGRLVAVGYCPEDVPFPAGKIMFLEMEVLGSLGCRPVDYPRIIEMVRGGRIRLDPVVTARVPLAEIESGLDLVRKGAGFRTVVTME